jgi:hypothetical protein
MSDINKLNNLVTAIATMTAAYKNALDTRTAPDSDKLGGQTLAQVQAAYGSEIAAAADAAAASLAAHIARRDNPHAVTAAQVGLGSVQDFGLASIEQAQAGVADDAYMTPAKSKAHFDARWAEKVGTAPETLDTIEEIALALQNNPDVVQSLQDLVNANATAISDLQATVSQNASDAGTAAAQAEANANAYTDAGLFTKLDSNAQAVDSAMLEGKSKAEVIAEAVAAADLDSKLDVGAQAVDSLRFNGKTQAEISASSQETIDGISTTKFVTPAGSKAAIEAKAATLQSSIDSNTAAIGVNATAISDLDVYLDDAFVQLTAAFNNAAANV